jgi:hypothetical protein
VTWKLPLPVPLKEIVLLLTVLTGYSLNLLELLRSGRVEVLAHAYVRREKAKQK